MRYLLPLLLFIALPLHGQTWYLKRHISWKDPIVSAKDMTFKDITAFVNSDYENYSSLLPRYFEIIPWQAENSNVTVSFYRAEYENVYPDADAAAKFSDLGDTIPITSHVSTAAGKPFVQVALVPFRKNPATGQIERLTAFVLKLESNPGPVKPNGVHSLKKSAISENSMLSTGNWFKIKVPETGMYKLTYSQLSSIGLADPAKVRIFGWGGACLPDNAALGEQDDLDETQIYMSKGSDGVFNAGDYILFYATGPVTWRYDQADSLFLHDLNPYSDYGYYFLTSDFGTAAEPLAEDAASGPATRTTDSYDFRTYHEKDEVNLLKLAELGSGREWYGEDFATMPVRTFDFTVPGIRGRRGGAVQNQRGGPFQGYQQLHHFRQ